MMKKILMMSLLFILASCTVTPPPTDPEALAYYNEINDPYESMNRKIFEFNQVIDKAVVKPVAEGYRFVVPKPGREGVTNVLNNLAEPVNLLNCIFQANFKCSIHSVMRFFINTSFGLAGLFDPATEMGLSRYDNSFGITLAKYGVPKGPLFVIPFFGQMYTRDIAGGAVDYVSKPLTAYDLIESPEGGFWKFEYYGRPVIEGISVREKFLDITNDLERNSVDLYASYREVLYRARQKQINDILGVAPEKQQEIYDFDIDDEDF